MHFLDIANNTAASTVFAMSLITAAAYARWHLWQKTGYGRSRMLLLLSLAALTLESFLRAVIAPPAGSATSFWLSAAGLGARTGVLISVTHLLVKIVYTAVARHRHPHAAARQARRHIETTPGATREETEKLLACWDEMHSGHCGDLAGRIRPAAEADPVESSFHQHVIAIRHQLPPAV